MSKMGFTERINYFEKLTVNFIFQINRKINYVVNFMTINPVVEYILRYIPVQARFRQNTKLV